MNSILIILLGALGDVARGFAVLEPIKKKYPDCKITWLVEPKCEGIVKLHPMIDNVIVFERNNGWKGLKKLIKELRSTNFDVTLDMQRHMKSGFFSIISGSKQRIGFHKKNSKEFNWIFNNEYIKYCNEQNTPKINQYIDFVKKLNINVDTISFGIDQSVYMNSLPNNLQNIKEKVVSLIVGSSWKSKDWDIEGYKKLSIDLINLGYKIVFVGDKNKYEDVNTFIQSEFNSVHSNSSELQSLAINLLGKTSLKELLAILNISTICVGPDSGPAHLAAITNTRFISLFGPTSPDRVFPYGNRDLVIQSEIGCNKCYRRECPGLNSLCMRLISPDIVKNKLLETLQE